MNGYRGIPFIPENRELGRVKPQEGASAFGFDGYAEIPTHVLSEDGKMIVPNPEYATAPNAVRFEFHPEAFFKR